MIGLVILAFLFSVAVFAAVHRNARPESTFCSELSPPLARGWCRASTSWAVRPTQPQHYFGLDGNARDEFSRIVWGARTSLAVGFVTVIWSIVVGALIGAVAGFMGGRLDNILMRLMDMLLAFPHCCWQSWLSRSWAKD